jgi:hypothetical protein
MNFLLLIEFEYVFAQLLKRGKFSKIDHGCYERDGEGKPSMVEMTLTRPVPTGSNFSTVL